MIDHVSLPVADLSAARAFYAAVLAPLGYRLLVERPASVAFGKRYPELWLNARPGRPPEPPGSGAHVCLRAASVEAVNAFHAAGLAAGGEDDGAPGLRAAAQVTYHGAFLRDPDGNRVEAMTVPPAAP
ncbi:MAG: VOC family protein [Pseudomonadota bacterium]|nr:VOC family protein [Pseudomonadota bacterium]